MAWYCYRALWLSSYTARVNSKCQKIHTHEAKDNTLKSEELKNDKGSLYSHIFVDTHILCHSTVTLPTNSRFSLFFCSRLKCYLYTYYIIDSAYVFIFDFILVQLICFIYNCVFFFFFVLSILVHCSTQL